MNLWPLKRVREQPNILWFDPFLLTLVKKDSVVCKEESCGTQSLRELWERTGPGRSQRTWTTLVVHVHVLVSYILASLFFLLRRRMKESNTWKVYLPGINCKPFCVYNHLNLSYHTEDSFQTPAPWWSAVFIAVTCQCWYHGAKYLCSESCSWLLCGRNAALTSLRAISECPGRELRCTLNKHHALHFQRGKHMHSYVLKGKHQRDCFKLKSLFISDQ